MVKSNPPEPLDLENLEDLQTEPQSVNTQSINSQLEVVAKADKSGFLSSQGSATYESVKQNIRNLNSQNRKLRGDLTEYQCKCNNLEAELQRLLNNLILSLEQKREELDFSIEERLKNGNLEGIEEQQCIEEKLQLVRQFQYRLQEGKKAAVWLDNSLEQWTRLAGRTALRWQIFHTPLSKIFHKYSSDEIDHFYFALKQLFERIIHCLIWGRPNVLDVLDIPLICNWRIHRIALKYILIQARKDSEDPSSSLSKESVAQTKEYIYYLIERLPRYPEN